MPGIDQNLSFVPLTIAVLTVSDTRSPEDDKSGSTLVERLTKAGHRLGDRAIVPDDVEAIRGTVKGWIADPAIDVVITSFTTGPGATTLPILIWSKVKLGVTPDINALATLIVVVVGIGVAIAGLVLHRLEKRREREIQAAIAANAP